jgi:hypothetical protein
VNQGVSSEAKSENWAGPAHSPMFISPSSQELEITIKVRQKKLNHDTVAMRGVAHAETLRHGKVRGGLP